MPMGICDIHGFQGCPTVSPGVLCAMQRKDPRDIILLRIHLDGEDEEAEFLYPSLYVTKEELGVCPLVGNLSKDDYEYVMTFKDEQSFDEALHIYKPVCGQCFREFIKENSEVIFPYYRNKG